MAAKRAGLGRGLDSLIPNKSAGKIYNNIEETASKSREKKAKSPSKPVRKAVKSSGSAGKSAESKKTKSVQKAVPEGAVYTAKSLKEEKSLNKEESPNKEESSNKEELLSEENARSEEKALPAEEIRGEEAPFAEESDKESGNSLTSEKAGHDGGTRNEENAVLSVRVSMVEPNRDQPRKKFNDEGIEELTSSIKQFGVIQPLLVQKKDDYYEIIAGERRWRAAKKAGLKEIPIIVKEFSNREAVEVSLIENIQREDLNPIEEAMAYGRLISDFTLTQEEVADRVSKSRSAVTNALRLLKLPENVKAMVVEGDLSEGHARTILAIPDQDIQTKLAERIIREKLSVRETERIVKKLISAPVVRPAEKNAEKEALLRDLSEKLKNIFGTKVEIRSSGKNKGKIEIEYYSDDELDRIFDLLESIN